MVNDETLVLEGEMSEVLSLMKKTFYSNKEIFLRELINNAFNALDKIRFERLTNLNNLDDELIIRLVPHKANKTLSVIDNGIGMTKDDLVDNLGVGFYSAYLVAHKVIITSKNDDLDQYIWESQPDASFIVTRDINAQQLQRGTKITLFLKDDQLEYLEEATIKNLINKHCQLITHPIYLWSENTKDRWQLINFWLRKQEMEKKIVAQRFQNHLPDDLAFSILFKLPLKSLRRFGCLCKSWALLFENSHFIDLFRINFITNHHSYYDDTSLLLCLTESDDQINYKPSLFLLSGERFQNMDKLNWPDPLERHLVKSSILGSSSINGIICLCPYHNNIVYLWNPATGEFKGIPPSPIEFVPDYIDLEITYHGFGYDCVKDDYKVIRHVCFFYMDNFEWDLRPLFEIYSLRSNSWRKLKFDNRFPSDSNNDNCLYLDGMCHWLCFTENDEACLLSFDMSNEAYYTTLTPLDIPSEIYDNFDIIFVERYLFLLNGSIALMSKYSSTTTFYISILAELGKKETWKKLFILGPLPCIAKPIGARSMGNILFQTYDDELAWFDLSTHKIEKLGVKVHRSIFQMIVYKESLIQIEGINS